MRPDDPPAPADAPPPPPPLLDPSEEEDLLRHLRRYQPRDARRRPRRTLVAAATVAAGAAVLVVVVAVVRRPDLPPPPPALEAVAPRAGSQVQTTTLDRSRRDDPAPVETAAPDTSRRQERAALPSVASTPSQPASLAPPDTPPTTVASVSYQPRARLAIVRPGDMKERVFDVFATAFEVRNGSMVRIQGMRLRARGRSRDHARMEVAEITLAGAGAQTLHWFLFADGRLVGWGQPAEWPATVRRYQLDIDYQPASPPATR